MDCIDLNYKGRNIYVIEGNRYRDSYNEFKKLSIATRKRIELLRGHHFFGSHEYLRKGAVYFTMLREPYSRFASLYNYLREIDLYKDINRKEMGFAEFLDSGLAMAADNGITRMLTNRDFAEVSNGEITEDLAEQAIQNLEEHFSVIGLMEQFDESMRLFRIKLNWNKMPPYTVSNKTNKKLVSVNDAAAFFEMNKSYKKYISADLKVYEYAKKRFKENIRNV